MPENLEKESFNQCKRCVNEFKGNFCPNCGQAVKLNRIDKQYILKELASILSFEKGILYSIRELLIRPGQSIRKFILEDRSRLVKPIIFIIVCSLIYTVLNQLFHFEDGYIKYSASNTATTTAMFEWIRKNYGYANIMMGAFIAFFTKLFFRKYDYNFFEILILLCFTMGMGMLIYSFFGIIEALTNYRILHIAGLIGVVYSSWATGQFFDKRKKINYLKAFFSNFAGILVFNIFIMVFGFLIDSVIA